MTKWDLFIESKDGSTSVNKIYHIISTKEKDHRISSMQKKHLYNSATFLVKHSTNQNGRKLPQHSKTHTWKNPQWISSSMMNDRRLFLQDQEHSNNTCLCPFCSAYY
jgi:hypothetical protein